jgi:hypothetical protein
MTQFASFGNGGFVLHKCLGKRLSAWYDKDGVLKDHELIDSLGRSRKASKHDIDVLTRLGKVYARPINMNNNTII